MTPTAGRIFRLRSACLVLLLALAPGAARAARLPYAVRAWTIADGLPTSTVQDIAQSPDGYLWLTTTGGLARFDGVRFTVFGLADGLASNRFQGLTVDREGALWIAAEDGTLVRRTGSTFTQHATGGTREATALLALPDGSVLAAGYREYWLWKDGARREFTLAIDSTTAPVADAAGQLWLTGNRGAPARLAGGRVEPLGPAGQSSDHWIVDQRDGAVRFARRSGADAELLDTSLRRIVLLAGAADESFQGIDRRGQLWSLAGDGVVARDAASGAVLGRLSLGLTSPRGRLFFDRQDNVWVGTFQQGLFRLSRSPVTLLRPDGLQSPLAFEGAQEDRSGRMIAWDAYGHVWVVEGTTLRAISHAEEDRLRFGSARLSYGFAGPYLELRDSTGAGGVVPVPRLTQLGILEDPVHPLSAILHSEDCLRAISAAPGRPAVRILLPAEPFSRDALFDRAGRLWDATVAGLWRLAPGDSQHFSRRDGLPADHLRQLHEDADGTLWIGTYGGGLARYKDGKFATLDHRRGLIEDVVSTVLEDDDGNLWLAGNAGIQRVSRAEANACLDGRQPRVLAVGYGRDAGLTNPETTGSPGHRSHDGRLWFGTFDGLAVVDPKLARASRGAGPVAMIEEVRSGDRALPRTAHGYALAPGQRRFEVRYTGIDLRAPEQVRFRYRLDGVDPDWIDAGETRVATYTNVPPGRHAFHLVAINGDGAKSPAPVEAEFDVAPWLWERLPVQAFALLLLLAALAWGYRYRSARLVARAAALERAVGERTAEVVEAKSRIETALTTVEAQASRLEALDRARSRFFASVSHEFRTPLTLIQGPLGDVTRGEHGALTDDARAQVGIALDSATRLQRLVEQLLDGARAEAGELRLERAPGDLALFLADLALAFAPLAERKRITFERDLPAGPLAASFDPLALEKVFANLLGNAFKFTPEGGHVWWRAVPVDGGAAIEIAVVDDGPGIAAEDLPHIFRHFYRSERSVTREQPGTGLGLALAHDMVEQHGGTLRVESREGHGATFTVRLPLLDETALPAPAPPLDAAAATALADEIRIVPADRAPAAAKSVDGDAPLVLVVDDHPDVRAYVVRQLARHYRVVEAADGAQALVRMREAVPDLVVSDLAMPGMDGLALCRAVRADLELEFVPVILLTAAAETESRLKAFAGGADDYVTKPFEVRELLARIARMLEARHRLRDHLARAAATEAVLGPTVSAPAPAEGASKVDTAFVRRIRDVVTARMGDEDFGVDELAEAMGMGRTLLFQRTRDLVGATPMELLMGRRLERAAELLTAGEGNVGEVAYAVGFRSVAHFTHRFRERFVITPSAWRRGERAP